MISENNGGGRIERQNFIEGVQFVVIIFKLGNKLTFDTAADHPAQIEALATPTGKIKVVIAGVENSFQKTEHFGQLLVRIPDLQCGAAYEQHIPEVA